MIRKGEQKEPHSQQYDDMRFNGKQKRRYVMIVLQKLQVMYLQLWLQLFRLSLLCVPPSECATPLARGN